MASLEDYLFLWLFVVIGAFFRMLFVFFRKNGRDFSKFRIEEVWDSTVSAVLAMLGTGLLNEIMTSIFNMSINPSSPLIWLLFIFLGYIGVDQYHQIQAKLDQKKGTRKTTIN